MTMNSHMHEFMSPGSESSPFHTSKVSLTQRAHYTILTVQPTFNSAVNFIEHLFIYQSEPTPSVLR